MNKENEIKNRVVIARLVNVTKTYNGIASAQEVLKKINFEAYPGEMVLLLGPSGSGKTTLLTLLGGMQHPTAGEVFLFGRNLVNYQKIELQKIRARKMGFIFQTFKLIDSLSVLENIMLVLKFAGIGRIEAKARANGILEKMGISHLACSMPVSISYGEKQRVAISRALVNDAQLIIADEPTGSLNTEQGMKIVGLLRKSVTSDNRCVVIASHDERIAGFADRVLYLQDGIIKSV